MAKNSGLTGRSSAGTLCAKPPEKKNPTSNVCNVGVPTKSNSTSSTLSSASPNVDIFDTSRVAPPIGSGTNGSAIPMILEISLT